MNNPNELTVYWSLPADRLCGLLASTTSGLSEEEADRRLKRYGPNSLESRQKLNPLKLLAAQFKSPIIIILFVTTVISAVVKDWIDAIIILVILLGSSLLSFFQEYRSGAAVEKLRAKITLKSRVLRGGKEMEIPSADIVPGDVVLLSAGNLIQADGVLIDVKDLSVNQAILTGETFPVEKSTGISAAESSLSERQNCVFQGTSVRSGMARALVVRTGGSTSFGQIAGKLALRPPETEFERGIRRFGYLLSEVMMVLVLVAFAINVFFHKPVLDALLFSVALAVGLTPQMLPAIISITLSRGAQRMAEKGVIVRRLASIENFGSMDVLCTDKTGTMTEGVVRLDGASDTAGRPSDEVFQFAYLNASLQAGLSNPLDEAIMERAKPDVGEVEKMDEIPYDFARRRLSIVVRKNGSPVLITKGALESVLEVCSKIRYGGTDEPLQPIQVKGIGERLTDWSRQGYRVLGVSVKAVEAASKHSRLDENEMVFLGFLLFFDPPKPDMRETLKQLEELGVKLKMITGDHKLVAMHVAEAIGLEIAGVVTGTELNEMRDEALMHTVEKVNVFASLDPNQKERIIRALRKMGHVVGYMGDGINDAPALHDADVGISVDKAVDVAKDASDFVLLEKDLDVLSQGIVMGRTTFANTLKYVFVTTSANFGNMATMAIASLFLPFLPLLPSQILLINFLTDFPAVAIAGDATDSEWTEKPHRWQIGFIRKFMITFGLTSSVFDMLTFAVLLLLLKVTMVPFRTGWFIESVLTELLVMLVMRTKKRFFMSTPGKGLLAGILLVGIATVVLPVTPLAGLFGFTAVPWSLLLILLGIVVLYAAASEGIKGVFYRITDF